MTDEQTPQEGKTNETQGTPGAAPAQSQPIASQGMEALPEWAQTLIKELRNEAAQHRVKSKELEDKETKRQQDELAAKGEWEKLARQREEALATRESELQTARLETAVIAAAAKAGFVDPSEAWALVDRSKIAYKDGKVDGVETAIADLAKAKPHLLQTNAPPSVPDHNPAGTTARDMSWHPRNRYGDLLGFNPFAPPSDKK